MNYNCIIIEDEKGALQNLIIALESYRNYKIIATETNVKDGLRKVLKNRPHLIFLDVELGGKNGFDLIEKLKTFYNSHIPKIIMTTAHDHYGKEAVNSGVLYFLSKPIDPYELQKALFIFEQEYSNENKLLLIKTTNDVNLFQFNDVMYFEGDRNYSRIFKSDGKVLTTAKTLKHFQNLLPYNFIRIHKRYIINKSFLMKYTIKTKKIILQSQLVSEIILPIGDTYFNHFKNSIG